MSTRADRRELQVRRQQAKMLALMSEHSCEIVMVRHGETQWNVEQRLQGQLVPGPGLTERGQRQAEVLAARLRHERFDCIYSSDVLRTLQTAQTIVAARVGDPDSTGPSAAWLGAGSAGPTAALAEPHAAGEPIPVAAAAMSVAAQSAAPAAAAQGASPRAAAAEQPTQSTAAPSLAAATDESRGAADAQGPPSVCQDSRLRERHLGVLQGLTRGDAARQHPQAYDALSNPCCAPQKGFPETIPELEARVEGALQDLAERHRGQRILLVCHGGFLQTAHKRAAGHHNAGRNVNASINTIRIDASGQQGQGRQRCAWALVRWGDADHLQGVGALASAFGGGTEG